MSRRGLAVGLALAVLTAVISLNGCGARGRPPPLTNSRVQVLAVWSGVEESRFRQVLDSFTRGTGASVEYVSSGHEDLAAVLAARRRAGRLPDVVIFPQPELLRQYARESVLVPIDDLVGEQVAHSYASVWRQLGSLNGRLYGLWFKAADKSLVWYDVAAFERAAVVPPVDLPGLLRVTQRLRSTGRLGFAVAGGDPWTFTDLFENLDLRLAGGQRYDLLVQHRIRWTDPSVVSALSMFVRLLRPDAEFLQRSAVDWRRTTFETSVDGVFGTHPVAAMVAEGDFVAATVTGTTRARLGVDADVFPFPSVDRSSESAQAVMGGGDAVALVHPTPAARALVRFLATPAAAEIWAAYGGFLSPNVNVDVSVYPDDLTRSFARALLDAGNDFHFDLSDQQPAAFGASEETGMQAVLGRVVRDGDVPRAAAELEADATEAFR
ncbi:MAG TPA: ABC transporter substrate-binding protein [Frankiaceae bacterium]|nr:ABC transporter substrate-binding protein [Frankiaceae bacterium]